MAKDSEKTEFSAGWIQDHTGSALINFTGLGLLCGGRFVVHTPTHDLPHILIFKRVFTIMMITCGKAMWYCCQGSF